MCMEGERFLVDMVKKRIKGFLYESNIQEATTSRTFVVITLGCDTRLWRGKSQELLFLHI